jgi:protein CpxP
MNFRSKFAGIAAAAVLMTGVTFAQAPDPGSNPAGKHHAAGGRGMHGKRFESMVARLNLTENQQQQAKTIFESARASSKPLMDQLRQLKLDLREAAKANRPAAEIEALAAKQADLRGQLTAIHTQAFASFYATLTPEQIEKAEQLRTKRKNWHGRRGGADRSAPTPR